MQCLLQALPAAVRSSLKSQLQLHLWCYHRWRCAGNCKSSPPPRPLAPTPPRQASASGSPIVARLGITPGKRLDVMMLSARSPNTPTIRVQRGAQRRRLSAGQIAIRAVVSGDLVVKPQRQGFSVCRTPRFAQSGLWGTPVSEAWSGSRSWRGTVVTCRACCSLDRTPARRFRYAQAPSTWCLQAPIYLSR